MSPNADVVSFEAPGVKKTLRCDRIEMLSGDHRAYRQTVGDVAGTAAVRDHGRQSLMEPDRNFLVLIGSKMLPQEKVNQLMIDDILPIGTPP